MKTLAFFNVEEGVGKASMVYHLAHMFAEKDKRVLIVDFDPTFDLNKLSLFDARVTKLNLNSGMLLKNLNFEDAKFILPLNQKEHPIQIINSYFHLIFEEYDKFKNGFKQSHVETILNNLQTLNKICNVDYIFINLGFNFGYLTQSSLSFCDKLIVKKRHLDYNNEQEFYLDEFFNRLPFNLRGNQLSLKDIACAVDKISFRTLQDISFHSKKPMFKLTQADGITGSQLEAVQKCYQQYSHLADSLL